MNHLVLYKSWQFHFQLSISHNNRLKTISFARGRRDLLMACISSLPLLYPTPKLSIFRTFSSSSIQFKRVALVPVKCSSSPKVDSDHESSSPAAISTYTWSAGIGALGFVETGYLTYLKLTNSVAFCPVGGGSCSDVLSSDYAVVFGVPLPLIGMIAYGLVAYLGLQLAGKNLPSGLSESNGRLILLGTTTTMAAASAYFLYLLSTKFTGTSCSYCLLSSFLSFSLFFLSLKDLGWNGIREVVGLQLAVAAVVVAVLNNSYDAAKPAIKSTNIDLLPYETEITSESSPLAISLANYLRAIGAKMYGAFWCSHCLEQKEMFGHEGAKILDYVECFPDGIGKGRKIAKECEAAGIDGFPTWVIKGKVLNGEQTFLDLMEASGFLEDFKPT
ncbi:thiol-disulfide oxidoreductase LTO1 isoform X2 [Aristolochia californica]|uniref:thiol-disulfide oxidoreductase LTO1 isoform X2 n=1 Tax=Aristolochia californica TaxID=171875 RepID=UPI0035DF981E